MSVNESEDMYPLEDALEEESDPSDEDELMERVDADQHLS